MHPASAIAVLAQEWMNKGGYKPPLVGCTPEELETLREKQQLSFLPQLYVEFMMIFGRNPGGLRHTGEFTFPHVLTFKEEWNQSLLWQDSCVFLTNHDAFALLFRTDEKHDNPTVYKIDEAPDDHEMGLEIEEYSLFSDFLHMWIKDEIAVHQKWSHK